MAKPKKKTKATKPPRREVKKAVQVSFDQKVLKELDANAKSRRIGRSAFITQAVLLFMRVKKAKDLDDHFTQVYQGRAEEMAAEVREFDGSRAWPPVSDLTRA
jgi:hypothetical protein